MSMQGVMKRIYPFKICVCVVDGFMTFHYHFDFLVSGPIRLLTSNSGGRSPMTARLPSWSDMWDTAEYRRKGTNIQGSNGAHLLSNLFLGHFEVKFYKSYYFLLLDSTFRLKKMEV